MDDKKSSVDQGDTPPAKVKNEFTLVPGVYPKHHKLTPAELAEQEAEEERQKIKAQWEAQQAEKKLEERKKAEEERQKAERELLYKELENLDYGLLSLSEYPSDFEVEVARRARLGWFFGLGVAVFLFASSLLNLVHPWVGGISGGIAFVLWLSHGTGMMRFLPGLGKHPELLTQRRRIKNQVTEYIVQTEGKRGYIHRIYPLVHFNARLRARKFRRIALMSKEHTLFNNIKTLQDVALYHEFVEEARKAAQEYFLQQAEDKLMEDLELDPKDFDFSEDADTTEEAEAAAKPSAEESKPADDQKPLQVRAKGQLEPDSSSDPVESTIKDHKADK
ncbi:hypothetical protein SAMN02745127_00559 [Oceanospirillum multiglobuliferum]|uniref:Uncharacterized protein n=1 Tax=Oceanospirillum multiglobuliferum TaxID=64969 RepID=A0A1T4LWR3_9GAMM|nr:hypothetical protein [Oceanospirillum multiglobuliferum]OPX56335.1 hypothetical protein BTE48_05025 [Oceanospirillum multiglobuliferum]SJZ59081.1 hypothetical protein SAMN02745127_00559 [Oceanospirillum multiglobuliferum]